MRKFVTLLWLSAGLLLPLVLLVTEQDAARSSLWWTQWVLLIGFLIAAARPPPRPGLGIMGYCALSVALGFLYETSLTVDGTGIGGVHQDTLPSFILAFGDYAALAIIAALAIRRLSLDFTATVILATGFALTEGLIFTGVLTQALRSPLALVTVPLLAAYYALVYASYIALPRLLLPPGQGSPPAAWKVLLTGFVLAFGVRLFWGLIYAPLATSAFGLPPNLQ